MDIKKMISDIFADGSFNVDAFIAALGEIVKAILGYVAGEEGYDYPAAE